MRTVRGITGLDLSQDQTKQFRVDVTALVAPLWMGVKDRAPAGPPVLLVGTTTEKTKCGG